MALKVKAFAGVQSEGREPTPAQTLTSVHAYVAPNK